MVLHGAGWRVDSGVRIQDVVKYVRQRGIPRTHGMVCPLVPAGPERGGLLADRIQEGCYACWVPTSNAIAS